MHKLTVKRSDSILRSHFRRSNNSRLWKLSGFIDLRRYGPDIMNYYAPNNQRAVIAKDVNINHVIWLKGHLMQKNPVAYVYKAKQRGWVKISK